MKPKKKRNQPNLGDQSIRRHTKFVPTDVCWAPNYPGDTVRVSCIEIGREVPLYRVVVWGNDDKGMEKDFGSAAEAFALYNEVEHVHSFEQLIALGFGYA